MRPTAGLHLSSIAALLLLTVSSGACGDDDAAPSPATAAAPEPTPAAEPDRAQGADAEGPADALAREVWEAAGGKSLGDVEELRFRFVATQDGEEVASAVHRWNRTTRRDHVTWTDREGRRYEALIDLGAQMACGTIDGAIAAGDAQQTLSELAHQRWVNDTYWLLMPLKLLDPGVVRTLEEPREHQGTRYSILRLDFEDVGLTPGDRYWLFVDPDTARVVRWEMQLQGQEGPPKAMSWTDWRTVGPLTLAFDHATDDGARHVRFEDVEALTAAPTDEVRVEGCP